MENKLFIGSYNNPNELVIKDQKYLMFVNIQKVCHVVDKLRFNSILFIYPFIIFFLFIYLTFYVDFLAVF